MYGAQTWRVAEKISDYLNLSLYKSLPKQHPWGKMVEHHQQRRPFGKTYEEKMKIQRRK